jgi:acetaldehyde dehydrogenase (acetylating)
MAQIEMSNRGSDRDLASIQEARALASRAKAALSEIVEFSQERIDRIVDEMAAAARVEADPLARLAVKETGYGVVADKIQKNLFAAEQVYQFIRPMKTVGVIRRLDDRHVIEIAEPFGVVAGLIPSTNPTSTAIYKILISVKARCPIVLSPHPSASNSVSRVAEIMTVAARNAGAPDGTIGCMRTVTLEGTQELMRHRDVAVILATGGMDLVRAAYSAGKPAYGVGPGNAPAYIEHSADLKKAVRDIVTGKTFDNGVLCSSENSVVVDEEIANAVKDEFVQLGGYFLSPSEVDAVAKALVTPQRLPSPALVGKSALYIAEQAKIEVPPETRVLLAPLKGVGRDFPLSIEKLCPVLAFYVVRDWKEGCERCKQLLHYGGMGHTMSIHSQNEDVILEFGLKKPAFRIVVNTPTTHGSIGLTTGLDPAMTLGCGGHGGNITSDNISPRHLLNIKRLAYEIRPSTSKSSSPSDRKLASSSVTPTRPRASGIEAKTLVAKIDAFLSTRGYATNSSREYSSSNTDTAPTEVRPLSQAPTAPPTKDDSVDFVCEDDVRQAIKEGRNILLAERAVVTPAARDLAGASNTIIEPD